MLPIILRCLSSPIVAKISYMSSAVHFRDPSLNDLNLTVVTYWLSNMATGDYQRIGSCKLDITPYT